MALGYCHGCERLVPIKPGPQKWGSRECAWRPLPHDHPDGGSCDGAKRELKGKGPVFPECATPLEVDAPEPVAEDDLA